MYKKILGWALSALMLSSTIAVAGADAKQHNNGRGNQSGVNKNSGLHKGWSKPNQGKHLGWTKQSNSARAGFNDDLDFDRFGRRSGWNGVNASSLANFDTRLAGMRSSIAARLSSGQLTVAQAAELNARLDQLSTRRNDLATSGGALTAAELADLVSRLGRLNAGLGAWF